MTDNEVQWMLKSVLDNVPNTLNVVLFSADGIAQESADDRLSPKEAESIAARMAGLQSLSRRTGGIVDPEAEADSWKQTFIEFGHGMVFLVAAGEGSYLAASATPQVDLRTISHNMHTLVGRLGRQMTAPARTAPSGARRVAKPGLNEASTRVPVLPSLRDLVDSVGGAKRAILVDFSGLANGISEEMQQDEVDRFAAAMHGLQGYSRAAASFAGGGSASTAQPRQTVVEFGLGWLVAISTGDGGCLAAVMDRRGDIGELADRMEDLVDRMSRQPHGSHELAGNP